MPAAKRKRESDPAEDRVALGDSVADQPTGSIVPGEPPGVQGEVCEGEADGSPLYRAACGYVARGFSVIPVAGNKRPDIEWAPYQERQPNEAELREWFLAPPKGRMLGIVTGAISGIVAVDVDPEGLGQIEELGLKAQPTPKQQTPRGGYHYVFQHPGGKVKTVAGIVEGVDIRADGGQIVAEPSRSAKGEYRWVVGLDEVEPAPLPDAVVSLLNSHRSAAAPAPAAPIPEGQRNSTLASLAGSMRRRGFSEAGILAALLEENRHRCRPPLAEDEVRGIAQSVARYDPEASAALEFITGEDFVARMAELRWLWEPWIPFGYLTLLAGEPGAGKSALALWIANCIMQGLPWPDGQPNSLRDQKALVLDSEGAQGIWADRMRKWRVPTPHVLFPGSDGYGRVLLDDPKALAGVEAVVRSEDVPLVIVDSLRTALGARIDENDSRIGPILSPWAEMARDTGIALVVVHHFGKGRPGDTHAASLSRVRGSTAIPAVGRSVLAIDHPDVEDRAKRLSVVKSNLANIPSALGFTWDESGFHFQEAPQLRRADTAIDKAREFVFQQLRGGPVRCADVKEAALAEGISHRTLSRAVKDMGVFTEPDPDDPTGRHKRWHLPEFSTSPTGSPIIRMSV